MKVINHEDLIMLLTFIDVRWRRKNYDLDDFEKLLNRFGDDYFAEGNRFVKTTENEEMARIRAMFKGEKDD